ncbi:hypothetical protein [Phormidium sp. FACHB-1136]|uniref:hypothetical protein n=1 Tax=Phormidium sp. FACHB-1136 TaxID=2692848 RepID=UPI0016854348|nr:hypothetical protein [Phormidium sp. FACHB-1136]MBD2428846.1 hypothetical protein [Phormidium sp. FACHB-1136]
MSLLDFFQDYKRLSNAGETSNPNRALVFLQREYNITSPSIINDFDTIWLNGKGEGQPLSFINVAKYFDPTLSHHIKAIEFLDGNISPGTRWKFEQIWHGKDDWRCPPDTDPNTGLPTGL